MAQLHLLDRHIGDQWPDLSTVDKVRAFEAVPFEERLAVHTTYDALRVGAAVNPDAPAIQFLAHADPADTPVVVTHRQFIARVTQTANLFHELGVGPGDVVSFLLPLIPQALFTLYGGEATGVANPVNPLLEPSQLVEILRAARTKVLVTLGPTPGTDIWEKACQVRAEMPELKIVVAVNPPPDAPDVVDFDARVAAQPADRLVSDRRILPGDVAAYFHTGGTTGTPKLVRHTHLNQVSQAWVIGLMLRSRPGGNILFGLPLFHVGGALTQGLAFLSAGGCLVVLSGAGWRHPSALRHVWKLVEKYRPLTFSAVPTVMAAAVHVPVGDADISSLENAAGGGSAIPIAVAQAYVDRFKLPVYEVYGMTETSSVHTISYQERPLRIGSVGHPVPYARVRVVKLDANGRYERDCATDEIGVVAMAGPGVFSGYLREDHDRNAFVEPGWVNSGDLGRLDAEGYLWITGRAKDLVIRGGHNIDPQPIEDILYQHPAVGLAAMVGQPDDYAGELPVAYVQPKPGATVDANDLIGFVRERTPERAAVPVSLYLIDAMPLTGVGKVFKPALRWDAARRVVQRMIADLTVPGRSLTVEVGAHPVHGSMITVRGAGVPEAERAALTARIDEKLGPLPMRHQIVWG